MGLETFTGKVSDLVETNPPGTDPKSQGDDHLRGIKKTIIGQAIKTQVGQHPTPSENYVIGCSEPNKLTIKRGTADAVGATVMEIVDGNVVTLVSSQVWQNLTASRLGDTTYANDSGMDIDVAITVEVSSGGTGASLLVGGVEVAKLATNLTGTNTTGTLYARVPYRSQYQFPLYAGTTIKQWAELRA